LDVSNTPQLKIWGGSKVGPQIEHMQGQVGVFFVLHLIDVIFLYNLNLLFFFLPLLFLPLAKQLNMLAFQCGLFGVVFFSLLQ
jgi:hypothetical protein